MLGAHLVSLQAHLFQYMRLPLGHCELVAPPPARRKRQRTVTVQRRAQSMFAHGLRLDATQEHRTPQHTLLHLQSRILYVCQTSRLCPQPFEFVVARYGGAATHDIA